MTAILAALAAALAVFHPAPKPAPPPAPTTTTSAAHTAPPRSSRDVKTPRGLEASRGVGKTYPARRGTAQPSTTNVPPAPCGGWRDLVDNYAWNANQACRVLMCESGGNPNARNGRYRGLFQVGNGSFDPVANVTQAHAMWRARGWSPWTCR